MSKVLPKRRRFIIRKKKKKREKIRKLKEKYFQAKSEEKKKRVIEKIKKISPHYPTEGLSEIKKEEEKK